MPEDEAAEEHKPRHVRKALTRVRTALQQRTDPHPRDVRQLLRWAADLERQRAEAEEEWSWLAVTARPWSAAQPV